MLKKIVIALVIVLLVIQFFRPEKNISNDVTHDITTVYEVPADVNHLLQVSCNDCHSNQTTYPWYAQIQPVGWWINGHIVNGKNALNLSEFTNSPLFMQNHKFDEIIELVEEKEMPLHSYTNLGMHSEANLSDEERELIVNWARAQMDFLRETYPADSLAFPARN